MCYVTIEWFLKAKRIHHLKGFGVTLRKVRKKLVKTHINQWTYDLNGTYIKHSCHAWNVTWTSYYKSMSFVKQSEFGEKKNLPTEKNIFIILPKIYNFSQCWQNMKEKYWKKLHLYSPIVAKVSLNNQKTLHSEKVIKCFHRFQSSTLNFFYLHYPVLKRLNSLTHVATIWVQNCDFCVFICFNVEFHDDSVS